MQRFQDKVSIVTGGASGLGKELAARLASEGATVLIADIDQHAIDEAVAELKATGANAAGVKLDVADRMQFHTVVDSIVEQFGRIDVLISNAGIIRHSPFDVTSDEHWDPVLAVDLKAVFYGAQAVAPHMIKQRYGKIVNIGSAAGFGTTSTAAGSRAGNATYACAKAAVIQLTKTLARELGPHGINVNSVAPGAFLSPMNNKTRSPEEARKFIADRAEATVLGRVGTPTEIANCVLFLASDESSYVAGQTLRVDGGRTDLI